MTRPPPKGWPEPLGREAMLGVLGQLVREVEPHTEADPVGITFASLATLGAMFGRGAYFQVEGTRHHASLFACQVGRTADGRKDTGAARAKQLSAEIDCEWTEAGRLSGLASGEGLIYALRDGDGLEDCGVADKRKLVMASEFAQVLKVIGREQNTLSAILRDLWDGSTLKNLTKGDGGLKATNPHVSILANITAEELQRVMTATEVANGLGNRFLWVCVRRSKFLPEGGGAFRWPQAIVDWLRESVVRAQSLGELRRTPAARELWRDIYIRHHSTERRGIYGSLTARGDAQMVRLGLLLALLDHADAIEPEHVLGAAELWRYAEASVRYVWGEAEGDSVTDRIVDLLGGAGGAGLTREQIRDAFQRNVSSDRLTLALRTLSEAGRAISVTESTGGRPRERWVLRANAVNAESPGNHRAETLSALPRLSAFGAELAAGGVA